MIKPNSSINYNQFEKMVRWHVFHLLQNTIIPIQVTLHHCSHALPQTIIPIQLILLACIIAHMLIETLYRENVSFRDRDLKRQIPCHTASENLDAQLLRNDTSFLSNLLCKSPLINYSPTIFVRLFQPIHWYETRILTFSSEKRAPISTMFTCRA